MGVSFDPASPVKIGWVPCVQGTSHLNAVGWLRAFKSPFINVGWVNSSTLEK